MQPIDVTCSYDDGMFDKDEQGWVTNATSVTQQGDVVTIRRWGDRNGLDPYDQSTTARIAQHFPELGLVKLEPGSLYIDLVKRRVRDASWASELATATAPADYAERSAAGLRMMVKIARLLGAPIPEALPLPEVPVGAEVPFATGKLLVKAGYSFELAWDGEPFVAKVFVRKDLHCHFVAKGPLERFPAAAALLTSWDWT